MNGTMHLVAERYCSLQGLVHECCGTGITHCRNCTESCHIPADLVDDMRWLNIVGSCGQLLTRNTQGLPYTRSATDACKYSFKDGRMPRTISNASAHCWSAWHVMSAFSVRCRFHEVVGGRMMGCCTLEVQAAEFRRASKSLISNCRLWSVVV
jgi:hypothetical protein